MKNGSFTNFMKVDLCGSMHSLRALFLATMFTLHFSFYRYYGCTCFFLLVRNRVNRPTHQHIYFQSDFSLSSGMQEFMSIINHRPLFNVLNDATKSANF